MEDKRQIQALIISNAMIGSAQSKSAELLAYLKSVSCSTVIFTGKTFADDTMYDNYWKVEDYKIMQRLFKMMAKNSSVYMMTSSVSYQQLFKMMGATRLRLDATFDVVLDGKQYHFIHPQSTKANFIQNKRDGFAWLKSAKKNLVNKVVVTSNEEASVETQIINEVCYTKINAGDFTSQLNVIEYTNGSWSIIKIADVLIEADQQSNDAVMGSITSALKRLNPFQSENNLSFN